ncbi:hypothetical protein ElyMa_001534900 [Elysia marginata]|uniref:Tyrosine-protein kinase ephrin type A/B receptor-like domain-containing protein n=1 Tax=Elysia marginata TaxID=1093978 RepID=A0AAV4J9I2_9GAST|nr:hypothetical protein ElyMa_001534900 [Elysia marginata]
MVSAFCMIFALLLISASCRKYEFPMCPPKEWKIPGGKIRSTGRVEYHLKCLYGFTQPLQYNGVGGHVCQDGKPEKLPRRCIRKIFAYVNLQFGIAAKQISPNKSACHDPVVSKKIEATEFHDIVVGQGLQDQRNDQLDSSVLRAKVNSCIDHTDGVSYMTVHVKNIPKGNGTADQVLKFYNFVISTAFKSVKRHIQFRGYRLVAATPVALAQVYEIRKKMLAESRSRRRRTAPATLPLVQSSALNVDQAARSGDFRDTLEPGENLAGQQFAEDRHADIDMTRADVNDTDGRGEERRGAASGATADLSLAKNRTKRANPKGNMAHAGRVAVRILILVCVFYILWSMMCVLCCMFYFLFYDLFHDLGEIHQSPTENILMVSLKLSVSETLLGCGRGWMLRKEGGAYKCYPCGPGFYSEVDTASTCLPCPVKYANAPWDAGSIDECFKVTVSSYDETKWSLVGYLLPVGFLSVLTIAVAWVSKVMIGTGSYRPASQRKSAKPPSQPCN